MSDAEIIVATLGTVGGRPRIKGTRITVDLLRNLASQGCSVERILEAYPHLTEEGVRAALAYGRQVSSSPVADGGG